ncbi:MAG: YkgJ family cysteine cluster protein [Spirochaetaceae bacterium]|nr:YkgJ family cysteine cluster protein [Spirochaetaceae bacterium]
MSKAKISYRDTKVFFTKLRKIKSGELDQIFELNHVRFSKEINCLDCANCCRGTGPLLKDRDIKKLSKSLCMKTNLFINTYLQTDEEGDLIFRELPCPFIGENNYCNVYEDRPVACREYPHTNRRNIKKYLFPTLENYTICPIVYLTVEELKKTIR